MTPHGGTTNACAWMMLHQAWQNLVWGGWVPAVNNSMLSAISEA